MKPIRSLYSLKAIGCLFVVMIHVPFVGRGPASPIINAAVPLFLMISGYLLWEPGEDPMMLSRKLAHAFRKMVRVIVIVNAVYLLYALFRFLVVPQETFPLCSWGDIVELILFGRKLNGTLWYLNTYLWTLALLWAICRCRAMKVISYLPLLLVLTFLLGRYLFMLPIGPLTFDERLNCFTIGLPFVAIGYIIHRNEERLRRIPGKELQVGILACIVMAYVESLTLSALGVNNHFSQFLFTTAYAILLVVWAVTHPDWQLHPLAQNIGKYHSANIYYYHILVANIYLSIGLFVPSVQAFIVFATVWLVSMGLKRGIGGIFKLLFGKIEIMD